ncbi:MAG: Gfo/Idh/MocA family oxidoreductase, partial [Phycisphaerales bacterium]
AMYAGKDVIIEKPIATNIRDAKEVLKVRERTGKIATVDYMMRFNPICICLAEYTHENIFGMLRRVNVENYAQDETLPIQHWFWNKKVSGGILIEHAVHFIDLVNYFSDQQYKTVQGISHKRKTGQEDQVFANVLYENGLIASHYHSFSRPRFFERTSIRLNYDLAEFDIEGWIPLKGYFRALANKEIHTAIKHLPNVNIKKETKLNKKLTRSVRSGGIKYNVDKMIEGRFEIKEDKQHVYAVCVRALLTDFLAKKKNPNHKLRVSLEDGISSLTIASLASKGTL